MNCLTVELNVQWRGEAKQIKQRTKGVDESSHENDLVVAQQARNNFSGANGYRAHRGVRGQLTGKRGKTIKKFYF